MDIYLINSNYINSYTDLLYKILLAASQNLPNLCQIGRVKVINIDIVRTYLD